MVPGSPALDGYPLNVYLPEAAAMDWFNTWTSYSTGEPRYDGFRSRGVPEGSGQHHEVEGKLRRFQDAIERPIKRS